MKLKKSFLFIAIMLGISLVNLPSSVSYAANNAQIKSDDITNRERGGVDPGSHTSNVVGGILNGVYEMAAIIAVLMLVIAGFRYVISDGDPGRIQAARKGVIYALVGLAIIGSAFIITGVVIGLFQ